MSVTYAQTDAPSLASSDTGGNERPEPRMPPGLATRLAVAIRGRPGAVIGSGSFREVPAIVRIGRSVSHEPPGWYPRSHPTPR